MSSFMDQWDIKPTAEFIKSRNFKRVTLQFPDHLLHDSPEVAAALGDAIRDNHDCEVFVLADSTYHSLGVDEVAAAHVNADCVVHYGYASLVPVSRIPSYFVFPKESLNLQQTASDLLHFAESCSTQPVLVFPDQTFHQNMAELQREVQKQQTQEKGTPMLLFASISAHYLDPPTSTAPKASQQTPPSKPGANTDAHFPPAIGSTLGGTSNGTRGSTIGSTSDGTRCSTIGSTNDGTRRSTIGGTSDGTRGSTTGGASDGTRGSSIGGTTDGTRGSTIGSTSGATAGENAAEQSIDAASVLLSELQIGGCGDCSCRGAAAAQLGNPCEPTNNSSSNNLSSNQEGQQHAANTTPTGETNTDSTACAPTQQPCTQPPAGCSTCGSTAGSCGRSTSTCDRTTRAYSSATSTGGDTVNTSFGSAAADAGCGAVMSSCCRNRTAPTGAGQNTDTASVGTVLQNGDVIGNEACQRLLCWQVPSGVLHEQCTCVWLGSSDSPLLLPLQLTLNQLPWNRYDPQCSSWEEGLLQPVTTLLRKRHYLVEKARGANIVGLLVGTLGSASCLPALERLRGLAHKAGKKTYTLLMGKPSPHKLANFPEIEVFVMLADPQGFILDSKEFYAPIITPYEAYLAFSSKPWTGEYSLDMDWLLERDLESEGVDEDKSTALVLSGAGALIPQASTGKEVVKSAAQYLVNKRTWHGLETPLTGAEVKEAELAQVGYTGRAATYAHEQNNDGSL